MEDFVQALLLHVTSELRGNDGEYMQAAIRIIDARNHIFVSAGNQRTDESEDIYALRDLCHLNELMEIEPDLNRIHAVARNYF